MPTTNAGLEKEAGSDYTFTGKTTIVLRGSRMDVYSHRDGDWNSMDLPSNGVIYVRNGNCAVSLPSPIVADYNEPNECATVYVSGTYSRSLTIASANDIVVNGNVVRDGDPVLGLIAEDFVRVAHQVNRNFAGAAYNKCTEVNPAQDRRIDAAILSLQH